MGGSIGPGSAKSSRGHRRTAWLPPFLVGVAGAGAAEMAVGLLLYSSEGFLRALTVVLVTEMAALGVGLLTSRGVGGANVAGLRRRWLLAVFTFAAAAVFAGAWGLSRDQPASSVSQGLGLALLAALPLFSVGAVLGSLSSGGDDVAAPASFGAAFGLLLTGFYGVPSLQPASLFLLCVVVVSAGALLHGWRMDRSVRILPPASDSDGEPRPRSSSTPLRASRCGAGELRRERRVRTTPRSELRLLFEGEHVADAAAVVKRTDARSGRGSARRNAEAGEGLEVCLPWQRHALEVLDDAIPLGDTETTSILILGVGTGALLASLEKRRWGHIVAFEPRRSGMAAHEPSGRPEEDDGQDALRPETPLARSWDRVSASAPTDGYDVVVVNLRLLPRDGLFGELNHEVLERALALRRPKGVALLGGVSLQDDRSVGRTLEWLESRCSVPTSLYRPRAGTWSWEDEPWEDLLPPLPDRGGGLVICRPAARREVAGTEAGSPPEEGP